MKVAKRFTFEAAHKIEGHPTCGQIHGHSYKVWVIVEGNVNETTGMVIDFKKLSSIVNPTIAILDHCYINALASADLTMPTAEMLAIVIAKRIRYSLPTERLTVQVWETEDSYAECTLE